MSVELDTRKFRLKDGFALSYEAAAYIRRNGKREIAKRTCKCRQCHLRIPQGMERIAYSIANIEADIWDHQDFGAYIHADECMPKEPLSPAVTDDDLKLWRLEIWRAASIIDENPSTIERAIKLGCIVPTAEGRITDAELEGFIRERFKRNRYDEQGNKLPGVRS